MNVTDSPTTLVHARAIDAARETLKGIARRTPLEHSPRLSALAGCPVYLKREDHQSVRSYKLRGAYLFMAALTPEQRNAGVVAASAGNHAQGVAYACHALGIKGRIYVPRTTPRQKRERIMSIGSDLIELLLVGETFDDAAHAASEDARDSGATLVPPFDHPTVMIGQGTVIAEALEQLSTEYDKRAGSVVIPVGGGGLLAGCGAYVRERSPQTRLIGVEPAGARSMAAALSQGEPVTLHDIDSFVDGAAVRRVGAHTFNVTKDLDVDLLGIEEGAVCTEMLSLYQVEGIIAEPAGALAAAAISSGAVTAPRGADGTPDPKSAIIVIVSGGNNDVSRYNEIVERSLVHEGLKHYFLVTFAQKPGALRRFLDQVLGPDDDITLFDYIKRNNREQGPALVGLEISRKEDLEPLLSRMAQANMDIVRIDPQDPMYRYLT